MHTSQARSGTRVHPPLLTFDCLFITPWDKVATGDELDFTEIEACDMKILVAVDTTSGSIFAHVVQKK